MQAVALIAARKSSRRLPILALPSNTRGRFACLRVLLLFCLAVLGLLAACEGKPREGLTPTSDPARYAPGQGSAGPSLKVLKVEPSQGRVHDPFTIVGEGLPPGESIQFEWTTQDGAFAVEASPGDVRFVGRKFTPKRAPLGRAVADSRGRVAASFVVPEDYGDARDIYGIANGKDVARGAFRIVGGATMSPAEGPVGTPITITVRGIGSQASENSLAVFYDNKYTGLATAVTTHGNAIIRLRASGPVGRHAVQVRTAGPGVPAMNLQQVPAGEAAIDFQAAFTVTGDPGAPPIVLDWPAGSRVATLSDAIPKTTVRGVPMTPGSMAGLEAPYGNAGSATSLWARGLPPNADLDLVWVTDQGIRLEPPTHSVTQISLGKARTDGDGFLRTTIQVPDDMGGWHIVRAIEGKTVLVETPYFIQGSVADIAPRRVKEGETFTIRLKGVGWTEVDNAVAITYDNAYVGHACGDGCMGDTTITLKASGGPGTHLIDLYPTVHRQPGTRPMDEAFFDLPLLTALQDHPGQRLGYELPVFHLAIEVTA